MFANHAWRKESSKIVNVMVFTKLTKPTKLTKLAKVLHRHWHHLPPIINANKNKTERMQETRSVDMRGIISNATVKLAVVVDMTRLSNCEIMIFFLKKGSLNISN